ncbi:hypothetical protein [Limnoglobus roseus]|nr:hypothetical protein [Limnoglobus roseus]
MAAIAAAIAIVLPTPGCGARSGPTTYQVARSDDGRCECEVIEYVDAKDYGMMLDLRIAMDGREVLGRSYLGNKPWVGSTRQFVVGRVGAFYCLSVAGHPGYALAATDATTGAVWFQSTDEPSRSIDDTFAATPSWPKLTDLNWMNAFVLAAGR